MKHWIENQHWMLAPVKVPRTSFIRSARVSTSHLQPRPGGVASEAKLPPAATNNTLLLIG